MKSRYLLMLLFLLIITGQTFGQQDSNYSPKVFIPFTINGKWGYADTLGNIICEPKFDSVGFFQIWQFSHAIIKKDGRLGVIDKDFHIVVQPQYKYLKVTNWYPKSDLSFLQVGNGKAWGVDAISGKHIIPVKYEDVDFNFLSHNIIAVKQKEKFALFSLAGKKLTDFKFNRIVPAASDNGRKELLVETDEGFFIHSEDNTLTPLPVRNEDLSVSLPKPVPPDFKKMRADKLANYHKMSLDLKDKFGLDSVYLDRPLSQMLLEGDLQYVLVSKNGKKGVWDVTTNQLDFYDYSDIASIQIYPSFFTGQYGFTELWYVQKDDKWGIVNEHGGIKIPFEYDGFGKISYFFAETRLKGKSGAIVHFTHYPPIPCKYDRIDFFQNLEVKNGWTFGLYEVILNGKTGYVGENGVAFFKFDQ